MTLTSSLPLISHDSSYHCSQTQSPFATITRQCLQGKGVLRTPSFWNALPKGSRSKHPSISRSPDICRILLWTGQFHSWSVGGDQDIITYNPVTRNPGSARVQKQRLVYLHLRHYHPTSNPATACHYLPSERKRKTWFFFFTTIQRN